jgi:hypothetical protein
MSQLAQISGEYVSLLVIGNTILGGGLWYFTRAAVKGLMDWKSDVDKTLVDLRVKMERHSADIEYVKRHQEDLRHG